MKTRFFLTLFAALLLTGCAPSSSNTSNNPDREPTSELEQFAACLTEKDAIFYGTEWCPHCKDQKALFADGAMDFINYIDCDKNPGTCQVAKITGYPTWIIGGEKRISGTQPLQNLAEETGCTAPTA